MGSQTEALAGAGCPPAGHITKFVSTNTVMSPSTDVLNDPSGDGCPIGLLSRFPTDSLVEALANSKKQDVNIDSQIEPTQKKSAAKARISKADLEIISSCDAFNDESLEKSSRRVHSADLSSSECHSRGGSDSEDMRRPFASIAREKKKQKKRKKNEDSDSVKSNSSSSEINDKISTSFRSVTEPSLSTVYPSNSNSPLSLTDYICDTKMPEQNAVQESLLYKDVIKKCAAGLKNKDIDSQSWILENGYVGSNSFDKHSEMIAEEISNTLFFSAKENQNRRHKPMQQLPKIKSLHFNIVKHKNKITNTFPPCFVVVKKLQMHKFLKYSNCADSILPLSARLKHLSELCDQGLVKCKKKKQDAGGELIYRNIFEETVLPETTEDEVDSSRKRNLRKRDKHISYVEPSEDDILDEFSRKRRSKHKDVAVRSEDESTAENKKKKKHTSLSESKTDYSNTATSKAVASKAVTVLLVAPPQGSSDRNKVLEDTGIGGEISKIKTKPNEKDKEVNREIIVYPPVSSGSKNYYYARAGTTTPKTGNSTLQMKQKPTGAMQISPPSTNITVLPTTTISGAFVHHPNPVSIFPSLSLGIPGSFPTQTIMPGTPLSSQISTAGGIKKQPQYCVVKMDGKDVLLQIVSSGGIGTAVPVVMPKGKALLTSSIPSVPLVAGSHFIGQPPVSLSSSTQSMSVPLTSVVTVSQGSVASAASLQPMMGIQVLSRPITTSSHNLSGSALPVIQPAQLTSMTNTTSVRPVNLSSVQQIPQSSTAFNSGVSVASFASARTMSALPAAVTPMAAPNTTTVVRTVRVPGPNLRAVAPNQSTSLHSFRIFVPGCSATGMPSRFATLGTIANTNPLTHLAASSLLLPQRKHSSDLEMTPEQRTAKRRKLEKKYPLPPGVVIKTEPLDAAPKPSPVITSVSGPRSLLSQNVHLLSSARPGTNFQSIRIISPSLANSLAARNLRGNSNIIYRAASIGGGQTILLPTSLGQISTRTTTTVTSVSVTSSSSLATSFSEPTLVSARKASDNTNTNAAIASDSSVSFSSFRPICENNVPSPVLQSAVFASVSSSAAGLSDTDTTFSSSVIVTSSIPLEAANGINTASISTPTSGAKSLHTSGTSVVAENRSLGSSPLLASAKRPCEGSSLENVRNALEELKKFIQVQEVCGLKGDRLEKLKELLQKKEEQYKDMLQLADGGISLLSAPKTNGNIGAADDTNIALNDKGGSETDPFVID
ncbi:unnamed protein product [Candidula unifasciata]|uniref:Uncharacterized protein n=1 Tax=Candidula unifasciata TaxID=100452 RepID=A0A8S3Z0R0_9EUPU|nr:unnamed protein product [Candidula unifasciata]